MSRWHCSLLVSGCLLGLLVQPVRAQAQQAPPTPPARGGPKGGKATSAWDFEKNVKPSAQAPKKGAPQPVPPQR